MITTATDERPYWIFGIDYDRVVFFYGKSDQSDLQWSKSKNIWEYAGVLYIINKTNMRLGWGCCFFFYQRQNCVNLIGRDEGGRREDVNCLWLVIICRVFQQENLGWWKRQMLLTINKEMTHNRHMEWGRRKASMFYIMQCGLKNNMKMMNQWLMPIAYLWSLVARPVLANQHTCSMMFKIV